jgi:hypothetical protein
MTPSGKKVEPPVNQVAAIERLIAAEEKTLDALKATALKAKGVHEAALEKDTEISQMVVSAKQAK